ncbi:MAG: hypothetical protein ACK5Y2_03115 [Bdellovibrionales bacterium]
MLETSSGPWWTVHEELQKAQIDYGAAKDQARRLDELLAYNCDAIEKALFESHSGSSAFPQQQYWFGLDLQSLQTPYSELVEMIKSLNPQVGDLWLDLGAAYGRLGVVLGFLRPGVRFVGYEYVDERVEEGSRIFKFWNLRQAKMRQVDLASKGFELGRAQVYFLYDFGSKRDVYSVLEKLRLQAQQGPICVVARGRGVRQWILQDFPWLSSQESLSPYPNWTVFQS